MEHMELWNAIDMYHHVSVFHGTIVSYRPTGIIWIIIWHDHSNCTRLCSAAVGEDTGGLTLVPAFSGLFAPYWRDDARAVAVGMQMTPHALCKVFCIYRNYINSSWYLYVLSSIILYSEMSMQLGTWPPGMTLYTSKEHMCRAALESTAFQAVDIMEAEKIAKKHEGTLNSDSFERCFDMLRCLMPHVSDQLQNHSRMRPWRTILVSGSSTWGLMVEWLWTIFWCRCRCFDYPYVTLMFECSAFWLLKAMKA